MNERPSQVFFVFVFFLARSSRSKLKTDLSSQFLISQFRFSKDENQIKTKMTMKMHTLSALLCCLLFGGARSFKAPSSKSKRAIAHVVQVPDAFAPLPDKTFHPFQEVMSLTEHTDKPFRSIDKAMALELAEATTLTVPPPVIDLKKRGPTMQTWQRRLVTKEDQRHLHKISNVGFVISSTAILLGMLIPNEHGQILQEIPNWLAPFDAMFLVSTTVQGLVAIPMILKHRKKDPEVGESQLGMGYISILMAVFTSWEGPFCNPILEEYWKPIFSVMILLVAAYDYKTSFSQYSDIQGHMEKVGVNLDFKTFQDKIRHFFCYRAAFVAGSAANLVFLVNLLDPARDRAEWLEFIQVAYNLPFCSGADMPLIYFSTALTATIVCYQSLLGTLVNKKLVSADVATYLISGSTFVIAWSLLQLLFARSLYG